MAQLTIDIPDELLERLQPLKPQLPQLLWRLLESTNLLSSTNPDIHPPLADIPTVYQEVLDFLITSPTPIEIVSFKVSDCVQDSLQALLEKNRSGVLTPTEEEELDLYEQLDYLMMLLKARAYQAIN
ncbi:MAG TPA: hypothetical protein DEG17_23985 [Cyanobacteria bacterium UBA11149]|nr:hypothetical protein [Cyanobacteria bacterium UBA11367]HBE56347.1 hypothetical protein [Cyanobacteria bacterium UBA11366]HBK65030.1 hypothetical protein [Cyanobacteria bacterium UBA11166]HBR76250.1 hypothetical protein [Cyanobacteria bacterium UBA11159]HBS70485.1 hypothetical protein [Cyanobacteria bacterium UBA11153]HBW91841.1 hypothetical protein [Cyanobacteria bacterium UBA11149]HCA94771.1 hypothetical protein [Cyanobacteria bacterium UBA9226]